MGLSLLEAIFCPARQNERSVVTLHERVITKLGKKWTQPSGLWPKIHHSALLVAYLEQPNYSPRALIGEFLVTTTAIQLVLTGPN